ncbi:MAG: rhodanese-like domain-containing protein [Phycisphaeraceae bacterium]|nr:MAG: rhodanese-like domain-containing protein [Phycisphaeraceae bacterium]
MLTRTLAIIGVAAIAGGVHSLVVPVHIAREKTAPILPGEDPAPETNTEPTRPDVGETTGDTAPSESVGKIDLKLAEQLHQKFEAGEPVVFLDARNKDEYDHGHIVGALSMPHTRVSGGDGLDELAIYASPGDGGLIVVYCTGGDCEASEDTAVLLDAAGYKNIAIMADGYDDWAAAGLPTETSEDAP